MDIPGRTFNYIEAVEAKFVLFRIAVTNGYRMNKITALSAIAGNTPVPNKIINGPGNSNSK